ncbi:ABC transporter ATP-binding protein [Magnetospirillum sp. 15-1]|uniref:ABC transporter ATP-binding protein n=1 Tax=Magnetospirillum sp. 15-1 TaxID=1979370 RepID=UPI000BBCC278|nr:ABC transporter ATP-binding protein [Magnetospirillum sp. 15-1]
MTSEIVISGKNLGKCYAIFPNPFARLKQMLVRGRRRYFKEYWALEGVDIEVRRGDAVGIIGRNGSGKSTLLQIIAGLLTPTTGEVEINGHIAAMLRLGAGFNPEFTGRENIGLAASVLGLTNAQVKERTPAIIEFAGIGDFIDQPVRTYSSGMHARLAFAISAHVDADILIIDEVLSVGDAAFVQKCMRFIHKFRQQHTLLFVSHDVNAVLNLCNKALWIDCGSVRAWGDAKDVCHQYQASLTNELDDSARFHIGGHRKQLPPAEAQQDFRAESLRGSQVPTRIEVFDFDPDAPWFGQRGATIEHVGLLDTDGNRPSLLHGGETLALEVTCRAERDLESPIVGFYIKDRLGQPLFGDNTYMVYRDTPARQRAGQIFKARFRFQMPYLAAGDYAVLAAIADGTQQVHVQHHWIDEALFFRVSHTHVARGLIGLPMLGIDIISDTATEAAHP